MSDAATDRADDGVRVPPIRRQVVVPTDVADAFALFTDEIGGWWPFDGHSVFGAGSTVAFTDGRLVERGPDGTLVDWGSVVDWSPPDRFTMTWHPGRGPDEATEVEVRFDGVPGPGGREHTLVTLEHRGWERRTDAVEAREEYHRGWGGVLARYADFVSEGRPPG